MDPLIINDMHVPYDDGSWLSARIGRIVDLIRERYPRLDVQWIPRQVRQEGDSAFRIVETSPSGQQHVILLVATEEEFNEKVLEQIYQMDTSKHDVGAMMEAADQAKRDLKRKTFEEAMEEAHDMARAMVRSKKHNYRINGKNIRL